MTSDVEMRSLLGYDMDVRSVWGKNTFDYVFSNAHGREEFYLFGTPIVVSTNNVVIVGGMRVLFNIECYMVNVYTPQDLEGKHQMWSYISSFIRCHEGKHQLWSYIIFGDFNVVKKRREIWFAIKLSKLDRFLVSEAIFDRFQALQVTVLDRKWSDHYPILIHDYKVDYGPTPFRFYNSWLVMGGLDGVCMGCSDDFVVNHIWSKFVLFKNEMKFNKNRIRERHVRAKSTRKEKKLELVSRLKVIDNLIDDEDSSVDFLNERKHMLGVVANMEKLESYDAT
uniref:Endonuclease/exonuclease/phosphatase domain-containing protein n=1 Tax=Lactuca sativa TaxID=4236 RepID=A0A9R1XF64_LACSA|nr:hypothetical protein LSAT_V11C400161050 [Lactuca sativa]